MTNRTTFQVRQRLVTVSLDNPVLISRRAWALISARVLDETTTRPPIVPLTLEAEETNVIPRVALDGLVGFAGIPEDSFPQLNVSAYQVHMTMTAPGFLEHRQTVTVPIDPTFPTTFTPLDLGIIDLHREPVSVRGRVTSPSALGPVPVAGANVSITGIWRTPPPATAPPPPSAADLIYVEPGAGLVRTVATCNVRRRDLTPVAGQDKILEAQADSEATEFRISDRVGIAVGSILALNPNDTGRGDFVTVANFAGGASVDEAATITITSPLMRRHLRGTTVRPLNAALAGLNNLLTADVVPGDSTLLLASMSGLAGGTHAEISDGIAADELRAMQLYQTITAADGFYRLPPISRVAQVQVTAVSGVNPPVNTVLRIDYGRGENRHDITIP